MPATNAWLRSRFLSSPRMAPDPLAPDLQGQRRVVGVRALLVAVQAGHGPVDAGRHAGRSCPSGSGRGSGPPAARRRRAASRRRAVQRGRVGRAASRADRTRARPRSWSAACRAGAASWKRPVSIGLTAIRSRSRSISRNLPRRRIDRTRCPTSASSSAGVPRTASGPGASTDRDRPPARAAWSASATTVRSGNSGTARRL